MSMKLAPLALLSALLCGTVATAQNVSVDFSGGTDFANNFRLIPISGHTIAQTGSFLTVTSNNVGTPAVVYVYDTTPASNAVQNTFSVGVGQSLSASLDFANISANGAATSIGFYFLNPTAEASTVNFMALININSSGGSEQFRFASGAALTSNQANGTLINGSPSLQEAGYGIQDPIFRTITATYTYNSATSVTLTLTAGSVVSTTTYNSITALDNVAVGFRVSPIAGVPASTLQLDNFAITAPVPEPSSYAALAGLGILGFAATRRRCRA
jgi:hypothetical protein